jgi:hypothetical protein
VPKYDLARFGYILDMKVEKKKKKNQNPFIFLATYWNLSSKSGNLIICFSKSGKFWPFFAWKILCESQNHIFQVKIWQNFAGHTGEQPTTRGISQIWLQVRGQL